MFLSVTANSSLDRIVFLEEFVPGKTMRTGDYLDSIGGKGFAVSLVQHTFELDHLALAFLAGETGNQIHQLIIHAGLHADLIWVEGETRTSNIVVETAHRRHSHIITPGYDVDEDEIDDLIERFQKHLPKADWVILAGSLPSGAPRDLYALLIQLAQEAGKPVLADCFGPPALAAVRAKPAITQMNAHEMVITFGLPAETLQEVHHSASALREKFDLDSLVITNGVDGIIAVTREHAWRAFGPRQVEVNGTGAGEAVAAMLTWRLKLGEDWPSALAWAAAAGSATVLTRGSGEVRVLDVQRLLPDIRVIDL